MQKGLAVPDARPHLSKVPFVTFLEAPTQLYKWHGGEFLKTPLEFFIER
jgi:hypothetical protein